MTGNKKGRVLFEIFFIVTSCELSLVYETRSQSLLPYTILYRNSGALFADLIKVSCNKTGFFLLYYDINNRCDIKITKRWFLVKSLSWSRLLSKVSGFGFNLPSPSTGLRSINLTMVRVGLVWQVSTWQHTRDEVTCNDNWIPPIHQREIPTSNTTLFDECRVVNNVVAGNLSTIVSHLIDIIYWDSTEDNVFDCFYSYNLILLSVISCSWVSEPDVYIVLWISISFTTAI